MSDTNQFPMRPPLGKWDYQGGLDTDAYFKHLQRPDDHKTIGRTNAKRAKRKSQRREWKKILES